MRVTIKNIEGHAAKQCPIGVLTVDVDGEVVGKPMILQPGESHDFTAAPGCTIRITEVCTDG